MNKEKLFRRVMLLVLLQLLLMAGLWAIDIGASIMILESAGMLAEASGLFGVRGGSTQYHMGLMAVYVVFMIQLAWILYMVINERGRKTE